MGRPHRAQLEANEGGRTGTASFSGISGLLSLVDESGSEFGWVDRIRDQAGSHGPISTSDAVAVLKKFSMSSTKSDAFALMYPHLQNQGDMEAIIDQVCEFEFKKDDMRKAVREMNNQ